MEHWVTVTDDRMWKCICGHGGAIVEQDLPMWKNMINNQKFVGVGKDHE